MGQFESLFSMVLSSMYPEICKYKCTWCDRGAAAVLVIGREVWCCGVAVPCGAL